MTPRAMWEHEEEPMAVAQGTEPVVRASLEALLDPPVVVRESSAPRQLLCTVSDAWTDDISAWRLARLLVPEAETFLDDIERQARERPDDERLAHLRGRARYAHVVALTLYRELRLAARRQA